MNTILVVCGSQESAESGMRVAADLSVASGARLSLAYVPEAVTITATADLDAAGYLSGVLFSPDNWRTPIRTFTRQDSRLWLDRIADRVENCWEAGSVGQLAAEVIVRKPDLIVTRDRELARVLVAKTSTPVWRIGARQREQSWFFLRKLRCAVRGPRAADWVGTFATVLGAEVETTPARFFTPDNADLVVIGRNERSSLVSTWTAPPVVVV